MVHGKGADISNVKQMQRWAEEKYITAHIVKKLADCAKAKGDFERADSYWNCYYCAKFVTTANGLLFTEYCKTRICALCNEIRKAIKIKFYLPVVQRWSDPFSMVLTVKNVPAKELNQRIDEMYILLEKIKNKYKTRFRRKTGIKLVGFRVFECTYNRTRDDYHPHFHLVVADRKIADVIRTEWIIEGQKLWGKESIYERSQKYRRIEKEGEENALARIIKYGTKIFSEHNPRNKKSKKGVYIEALDTIIAAMEDRRIFDRFGFNLPSRPKEEKRVQYLKDYKAWTFVCEYADWLEKDGALSLSNFVIQDEMRVFFNESIINTKTHEFPPKKFIIY
ncbi:MAG: protein rep [Bacteroidetes bacterium]|nr:protein rep [Bacteroidota bacterium]